MRQRRTTRHRLTAALALAIMTAFVVVAPGSGAAQAADRSGQLVLVMDSSGSMAGPDGSGGTKIQAAKRALDHLVNTAPADARMGLRVYGAGKDKNDPTACRDSKLRVPVGPVDKAAIKRVAASLQPRGQTPLAYSLKKAAGDFTQGGPRTILLVSDGIETCDPHPCAVARKLRDQGIQLRIDVVGFRVEEKARKQLQCIARAGHGMYYDVTDGPSLRTTVTRNAVRALRQYRPAGTPIDGTTDPIGAPLIKPGKYLDTMPLSPSKSDLRPKYYVFDRHRGETVHITATLVPPMSTHGRRVVRAVGLEVLTEDGTACESNGGGKVGLGSTGPVSGTVTLDLDNVAADCTKPGRFRVAVISLAKGGSGRSLPMELLMLTEPRVTNLDALPEEDSDTEQTEPDAPKSGGAKVVGGASYADAPTITPGTYTDTIRPGETLFYRVEVDWGQRLAYRVDFPPLTGPVARKPGRADTQTIVTSDSPLRTEAKPVYVEGDPHKPYNGTTLTIWGSSPEVRYRNRESITDGVKSASVAGYYYIELRMVSKANDVRFEAPFRLTVEAQGTPHGEPHYVRTAFGDPVSQQEAHATPAQAAPASQDDQVAGSPSTSARAAESPSTATWVAVGLGILLIVGGGAATAVALALRRH
ncbi:MAG: vWA domain-containing protein [Streptosporangiaceae bacterium]